MQNNIKINVLFSGGEEGSLLKKALKYYFSFRDWLKII